MKRNQEFGEMRWVWVVLLLCALCSMACLMGGEDMDDVDDDAPKHACFVHCQAAFGVSSACFSSSSDYQNESECSSKASDYCGSSGVSQSEQVSDCNCSSSCEPGWYNQ